MVNRPPEFPYTPQKLSKGRMFIYAAAAAAALFSLLQMDADNGSKNKKSAKPAAVKPADPLQQEIDERDRKAITDITILHEATGIRD